MRIRHGQHYDQNYAPVASWNSTRTLLIISVLNKYHTRQNEFFLAFTQAPVESKIRMDIPEVFQIKDGNTKDDVLKLHMKIYSQKQAGWVWNTYLTYILINKVGFKQSKVYKCIFYRGNVMFVLYTDDSILAGPDPKYIGHAIKDIKYDKLNITDKWYIQDFLGGKH